MTLHSYKLCSAAGCQETIPLHMLMCAAHWRMVPSSIQSEIYRTLKAWKNDGPIRPYVRATLRAELAVAEKTQRSAAVIAAIRAALDKYSVAGGDRCDRMNRP